MTTNPYGWHLPLTDQMLDESPYAPLADPAQNVAERLVMLGHLCFNVKVWGGSTGRAKRYWEAYGERIEGAANNPDVASWWCTLMDDLPGVPLRSTPLLHEKNLLCHPMTLPSTQVPDDEVLSVLRVYTLDLRDRARVWAKTRRDLKNAVTPNDDEEDSL